jgi:ribosomal protein S18 acetylase RimI-like enzyme
VRLLPLPEEEIPVVLERSRIDYRAQLVGFAGMSEELATRKADADFATPPPASELFAVEADDGRRVGVLRFAEREYYGEPRVFLYDVWIEPAERGRGYGRGAMLALEATARERGLRIIDFNVWGGNAVARSLYRSLGYEERAVFMSKDL